MPDGSCVTYSHGWCGTHDKCALNEKGLLYNNTEGYGIGQAEGDFVPKEVIVISSSEAGKILSLAIDEDEVYFGQKLADRWLLKAEEM